MGRITLCTLALLLFFTACNNQPSPSLEASPTPTPTPTSALAEIQFQASPDPNGEMRAEARRAVTEYLRVAARGWAVKGLALQLYAGNEFSVSAHVEKDNKRAVISLVVRRFYPENGNPYWLAILSDRSIEAQLHDLSDRALEDELSKLRAASEDDDQK
jgi:hypothetical protein